MSDSSSFGFELQWDGGYAFRVDYDRPEGFVMEVDEPPPLGEGRGPNPARLLATAVAHCLSSSLLFCLSKSRVDVKAMRARVEGETVRNEAGRLRIGGIRVSIEIDAPQDEVKRILRCSDLFEDFCVVSASVRSGIPIEVEVNPPGA